MSHRYTPAAVDREIERERRRSRVSRSEARLIHAILKGRKA